MGLLNAAIALATRIDKAPQSFGRIVSGIGKGASGTPTDSIVDPEGAEKPFAPYYASHIQPHTQLFEQRRLEALAENKWRTNKSIFLALGLVAACAAIMYFTWNTDAVELGFWLLIIGAICIGVWVYLPIARYKGGIKEEIFPIIFKFFGDDYTYEPEGRMRASDLQPSRIIPSFTYESVEDYVKGSHKNVAIELTEMKLERKSGKNSRSTVFRGIAIRLSAHKKFQGHTIITGDSNFVGRFLKQKFSGMERVALEDVRFEDTFDVYGTDQIEARYLLTTSFMERLLHLKTLFAGSDIRASFYDNSLLLMIESRKDRFEVGSVHEPVTFYHDINTILSEMQDIFAMIEHLKLHEQTGL